MFSSHFQFPCWEICTLFFLIRLFVLLMTNFLSSLYILDISPLSDMGLVKIFSQSVCCLFVLLTLTFALQKLLSFRRSHLFIVALSVLVLYFRSGLLCPCIEGYFPLSLLCSSVWLDLYWDLWSIWIWVLCMGIDMDLFAFFYMLASSYARPICWRWFLFSIL